MIENKNDSYNLANQIIEKCDIVGVIGSFIKLTKKGANYVAVCPFHSDTNPSLSVSPTKKIWKCFVCGAKGNVISFVQKFKKISFIEAVKVVAEISHIDISKYGKLFSNTYSDPKIKTLLDMNTHINTYYEGFLYNEENKSNLQYLHKRGLNDEIIKFFHLGYAPKEPRMIYEICINKDNMFGEDYDKNLIWNEQQLVENSVININEKGEIFDFLIDRITFPIMNQNGYILAYSGRTTTDRQPKYLNSKETKIFNKGSCFYNINNFVNEKTDELILVEGYMDVIAYYRAGYKNVMALMGVGLTQTHIQILSSFNDIKTIIVSFDNDQAGANANVMIGKALLEKGWNISVVAPYDANIKDVDELITKKGPESIKKIIQDRTDFFTYLINYTFKKTLSQDQKLNELNSILSYMAKNPETLLKSKHFETLALISGFNLLDIQDKYEYHFKKEIGGEFIKNTAPPHPTRSTHESYVNSQQQTFSKPTQKPQENVNAQIIQHRKKIANAMTGIRNNIIEIIRFCLANNDFIALSEKRLNNFILIEEPIPVLPDILKILFSLKEQATQITYAGFLEMLDTEYKTSGNYQDIKNILLQTPQLKKPLPNIDHTVLLKEFLKMVGHVNDLFYVFKVEKISMDITLECLSPTPNAEKLSKLREILVQTKNKNNV